MPAILAERVVHHAAILLDVVDAHGDAVECVVEAGGSPSSRPRAPGARAADRILRVRVGPSSLWLVERLCARELPVPENCHGFTALA